MADCEVLNPLLFLTLPSGPGVKTLSDLTGK